MRTSGHIYRVARKPHPWAPLDWRWSEPDGTFGNRFDDANGRFRVLYASSQLLGCFLETLARFRVDPTLLAELSEISGDDDFQPLGTVPSEWLSKRIIGVATTTAEFADICSAQWIGKLRPRMARFLAIHGFGDFDASVLQQTRDRRITQLAATIAYDFGADGVYYRSKHGHDIDNWAIFEPFRIDPLRTETIKRTNPDLQRALTIHGLALDKPHFH